MYAPERHQQILDTALSRGRVEVAGLARELAVARRLSPNVDRTYARYGIKAS